MNDCSSELAMWLKAKGLPQRIHDMCPRWGQWYDQCVRRRRATGMPGYVYLIRSSTGYCKIGISTDVHRRLVELSNHADIGITFSLEYYIVSNDAANLEALLHWVWHHKRADEDLPQHTEWFDLSDEDVRLFKEVQWEQARVRQMS